MKWTVIRNDAPKPNEMHLEGDHSHWTVGYEDAFDFYLKVEAEHPEDVGKCVGLNQTLLSSDRISTYEQQGHPGIVTLRAVLEKGPPCLDGDEDHRPFYNGRAAAQPLPPVGKSVTLELRDDPLANVAERVRHGQEVKSIKNYHAKEHFLISLVEFDPKHKPAKDDTAAWNKLIKAQWEWSYEYVVEPNPKVPTRPQRVSSQVHPIAAVKSGPVHLVADGPAAGIGLKKVSTPPGWIPEGEPH